MGSLITFLSGFLCPRPRDPTIGRCLTDTIAVCEAEYSFHLVEGDVFLDLDHIPVESGTRPSEKRTKKFTMYPTRHHSDVIYDLQPIRCVGEGWFVVLPQ